MSMQLVVTKGPQPGQSTVLSDGQTVLVGRGQDASFQVQDPRVSRKHFELRVEDGRAVLKDLGSAAGTFVNGQKVSETALSSGDRIVIGESEIRFQSEDASAETVKPQSSPNDLSSLVGQTIHTYRVDSVLASGKTGMVFKAHDTKKERDIALKVLWPEMSKDEDEMQRFVRAMKTMFGIHHPNIVRIYNAGKTGPHVWVSLEYVDGESLSNVIKRIGTSNMLDWQYAFRVAVHMGRALEAASDQQIIHRNLTPENILIRKDDDVAKLGDMMLAKALEGTQAEQVTRPGEMVGEVTYMSPERTKGSEDVDCRSDIYSLGATIYALLTGRPPFEGSSLPDLINKVRNETPTKPKEFQLSIADMFQDAVLRMLEKRPDDRYSTPTALLKDLERIGKFQGVEVP